MLLNLTARSIRPKILSVRLIPAPNIELAGALSGNVPKTVSYGLISCDFDDALHVALDEATKASPVHVLHVRSMYAGLTRTADPHTGEAFGILHGSDDEIVREGLKAAVRTLNNDLTLFETDTTPSVTFFAHIVTSIGEHLSKRSGVAEGEALAYLVAPPVESIVALDASLKAAQVKLVKYFPPPMQTNRGGALLTGSIEECQAAAQAFGDVISRMAGGPIQELDRKNR